MPAAATIVEAIYAKLDGATTAPVSPELRVQGDPTPAIVYEVVSCAWSLDVAGTSTGHGTATVRVDCVADTVVAAWSLAKVAREALDGKWTEGSITMVMTSAEAAMSRAAPDDGQADAERVVTITAEFQFIDE